MGGQTTNGEGGQSFTPRRAVLYVPGSDERKLAKLAGLTVDCAVMDCEDGVAANRKVCSFDSPPHLSCPFLILPPPYPSQNKILKLLKTNKKPN